MKTLVIGLGNPILGDDGVGWRVVEAVQEQINDSSVDVDCAAVGGITLMEHLIGYDRAILIDAVITHQPIGTVSLFRLNELTEHSTLHTSSAHDASLQTAIAAGKAMGAHLPHDVIIIGIEAEKIHDFSEELSPQVEAAVPRAADEVLLLLEKETHYDLT
ncbi:MAG: hydrogenase maturation protease [Chloroflexi bacterium]|nr:hydrogenase maturation protease [Chloroflexota bacterium]MBI5080930.1 hydrogenase maturation protease [Chloroflexota bacterium]MBI5349667.1 hydrogenase maturation protease [Chloroflexota bacterium]